MISILVPIKNEEENIRPLVLEIEKVMTLLEKPWELIYVNDGSSDQSQEKLLEMKREKPFLRLLHFSENQGQSTAMYAGFQAARGEWIISLDGDGQNDPKDIPKLLKDLGAWDLVCGWRASRKDSLAKKIISRIANKCRSYLCQDGVHDTGCSLKLYRASCLKKIYPFHGMHRFLPALFRLHGFCVKEVVVNHRSRQRGKSHYNIFNRSLAPIMDMFAVYWMRRRKLSDQSPKEIS